MNTHKIFVDSVIIGCIAVACTVGTTVSAMAATKGALNDSGVNVRAADSTMSDVVDKLNEGDTVDIISKVGDWFNVSYSDKTAYIYKDYIEITEAEAVVIEDRVDLRETPDADGTRIFKLYEGETVTAKGVAGDWVLVEADDTEGYIPKNSISSDYIAFLEQVDYATAVSDEYGLVTAVTGLNLRTEPKLDSEIVEVLPFMTKAEIIDENDEWIHILTDDGKEGYVSADYLSVSTGEGDNEALTLGGQIINFAKQYIGTPYVWGGTNLSTGVDCSGFVYCVYKNFGIALTRSSAGMAANDGYLIDKSELQAGDLVFFDNDGNGTIDHVGIYMYDGYYIHSSSGIRDGVIISSLSDVYGVTSFAYAKRVL